MAGAPRGNDSNSPIAEINVIPLVDIILVVLIIFMVAAPLVMKPKIDISLPKSTSMDLNKDKTPMRVVLGKKGEIFVDNEAVSLEGLTEASKKRVAQNPAVTALLVADKDATLAMITDIVDSVKTGGVGKVAFSIQKK
jgi:biopolymer transport protein ExbD